MTNHNSSPRRSFKRIRGEEPSIALDVSKTKKSRDIKALTLTGGHAGRMLQGDGHWSFSAKKENNTLSAEDKDLHQNTKSWDINKDDSQRRYQMVDMVLMEKLINENCVCKCNLNRDLNRFVRHCSTSNNQSTAEDLKEVASKWKRNRCNKSSLEVVADNIGLESMITIQCNLCNKEEHLLNETTKYYGKRYDGEVTKRQNCSWFTTNVKLVLGTLASGLGASDISGLFSFIGLPNLNSFSKKAFKRIETLIGKYIRQVAHMSMDNSLEEEVQKTLLYKKMEVDDWKQVDNPIGLTCSYDMGWSKRSSGKTYDSLSGHAFLIGCHSQKIVSLKVTSKQCSFCTAAEEKGREPGDHECPKNYDGSSKAMEADGALSLVKELDERSNSKLFVEALVTDDDSSIRAILSHDKTPNKKGKGKLPSHIPEPRWLADPSHRTRVVARAMFALAALRLDVSECRTIDAHRFKKYYGYMIKQCRNSTLEEIMERSKAVLLHLFSDHIFCDPVWCKPLRAEQEKDGEGMTHEHSDDDADNQKVSYYRSKIDHAELFEQMRKAYEFYITPERLLESLHPFDTQLNEALNNVVARYAPKNRTYGTSMSLNIRICIVAGIHNMGHYLFWLKVFELIGITMPSDLVDNLQRLDRQKTWKRTYSSKLEVKSKRRRLHNEKMQQQLKKQIEDSKRGATYRTGIVMDEIVPSSVMKLECELRAKENITCKFYGCRGNNHRTNLSKRCTYHNFRTSSELRSAMDSTLRRLYPTHFCTEISSLSK